MVCAYCNKEFKGRKRKYCSKECYRNADKDNKRIQYIGKRETKCSFCGKPLPKYKTRYCSSECATRGYNFSKGLITHSEILTKKCVICGATFQTWRNKQSCCSTKCQKERELQLSQAHEKRYKGITVDKNINLKSLANRDHNQCQICGLFVDWEDKYITNGRTVCGDMYPSIDHILPVSKGGLHAWSNIQLAHRICNMRKSNKVVIKG